MTEISLLNDVHQLYQTITLTLIEQKKTVCTMESCTSGIVASLITDTEGASAVLKRSFISYSNQAKIDFGVSSEIIEHYGIYSKDTAIAMASAAKRNAMADYGIGITGSFGNTDPNNPDSVPGQADVAVSYGSDTACIHVLIPGDLDRFSSKLFVAQKAGELLLSCMQYKKLPGDQK